MGFSSLVKNPLTRLNMFLIYVSISSVIIICQADRIVLRADVVKDYLGMCYDVANCLPRSVNETWSIGACAVAKCERHESGMLLEVRMTCPRFLKHVRSRCNYIENTKLPFPLCCPHTVCKKDNTTARKKSTSLLKEISKQLESTASDMHLHRLPDTRTSQIPT